MHKNFSTVTCRTFIATSLRFGSQTMQVIPLLFLRPAGSRASLERNKSFATARNQNFQLLILVPALPSSKVSHPHPTITLHITFLFGTKSEYQNYVNDFVSQQKKRSKDLGIASKKITISLKKCDNKWVAVSYYFVIYFSLSWKQLQHFFLF